MTRVHSPRFPLRFYESVCVQYLILGLALLIVFVDINMDNGGWYTRKRKATSSSDGATTSGGDNDVSAAIVAKKLSDDSTNNSNIPKSLLPYLGWTKLTACKLQRRKKRRVDTTWSADEGLQKVTGRAVVSFVVVIYLSISCALYFRVLIPYYAPFLISVLHP